MGKKQADYSDDDVKHMRKVVSYVHRHLAQQPEGDVEDTRWRYSLADELRPRPAQRVEA